MKILIVDDDPCIRQLLSECLLVIYDVGKSDVEVLQAGDASTALRIFNDECPDLVVTDVDLHDRIDGINLAKIMKATRDVPILVASGSFDQRDVYARIRQSGLIKLPKPFTIDELRVALNEVIRGYPIGSY